MELTYGRKRYGYIQLQKRYFYLICLGGMIFMIAIIYSNDQSMPMDFRSIIQRSILLPNKATGDSNDILSELDPRSKSKKSGEETLILIWTSHFGRVWDEALRMFDGCPQSHNCILTADRSRASESAAILFHIRDLNWSDIPKNRNIDQYYIFGLWESPHHTGIDLWIYPDFFNLTFTYRRDSDVFCPYGAFREYSSNFSSKSDQLSMIVRGKSKSIAWFASNCEVPSGRGPLVEKLQDYIPVDIYGYCGTLTCGREKSGWETGMEDASSCNQLLTKDYKFYLSFENSLCRDYVTEKLYFHMDNSLIVPIVMERKILMNTILDKETNRIINNSIIAVDDFTNVKQLADYLKYLDQNTTEYMKYFQWRETHQVVFDSHVCQLCNVIMEKKEHKIRNIANWWINEANCHSWN